MVACKGKGSPPLLEAPRGELAAVGQQVILLAEGLRLHNEVAGDLAALQPSMAILMGLKSLAKPYSTPSTHHLKA